MPSPLNMTTVYRMSFLLTAVLFVSATFSQETEVPPQPATLQVTSRLDSVLVQWTPPPPESNIVVIGYVLGYGKDIPDVYSVALGADTHEYTLGNLEPDSTYVISIRAFNTIGQGQVRYKIIQTARETEVPPQPTTLQVMSRGDSVLVVWDQTSPEPNIVVRGYLLGWGRDIADVYSVVLGADTHEYTLGSVEPNSTYVVSIRAYNTAGTSRARYNTIHTVETEVPLKPAALQVRSLGDSVLVMWAPPSPESNIVRGYLLGYGKDMPDIQSVVLETDTHEYTIGNLETDSTYVISIRAFNIIGHSYPKYETVYTARDEVDIQTPMMSPLGLRVTVLSPTSVRLTWVDSDLGRSQEIRDGRFYTVRIRNLSNTSQSPDLLNTTELNASVETLEPNTQYEFTVKVSEGERHSTWSMDAHVTTSQ